MRTLVLSAFLLWAAPAVARQEPDSEDGRATTFERAEGSQERVPGGALLVAAYAVIWLLVLGFVVLQWRRVHKLESEVDRLTRALKQAGKDGSG